MGVNVVDEHNTHILTRIHPVIPYNSKPIALQHTTAIDASYFAREAQSVQEL